MDSKKYWILDYAMMVNSAICIIAAGSRGNNEDKEAAAMRNTEIFKTIIPEVVQRSPDCILIVVSHPGKKKLI